MDTGGSEGWLEVIGVAGDAKYRTLSEGPTPFFYLPFPQTYGPGMSLVVRTDREPRAMLAPVRQAVLALDPNLPLFEVETLSEHLGIALFPVRLASSVLGWFGLLALLLAAIGLYGVVAYAVNQRTREIGVRMALGARPADVLRLVVGDGMRLALLGLGLGLAAALLVTRMVAGLLYGVSPTDPVAFTGVAALLLLATLLASWLPARRAARVDPMTALKHE
jgi:predicted lysophospholipase L1 biosynthesis ABC-type transport system permease subunit